MESLDIVPVDLGDRSYDICIGPGILESLGELLLKKFGKRQIFIVTDEAVAIHWLKLATNSLEKSGFKTESVQLPSGESTKSFFQLEGLIDQFLNARLARDGLIVALGGGVVGDLTGFAAAITLRGINRKSVV